MMWKDELKTALNKLEAASHPAEDAAQRSRLPIILRPTFMGMLAERLEEDAEDFEAAAKAAREAAAICRENAE